MLVCFLMHGSLPAQHLPWLEPGQLVGSSQENWKSVTRDDGGDVALACWLPPWAGVRLRILAALAHFPCMHELCWCLSSKIGAETGRWPRCPIAGSQTAVEPRERPLRFADRTAPDGHQKIPPLMSGNVHPMPDRCMQGPGRLPEIVGPEISQAWQPGRLQEKVKNMFPARASSPIPSSLKVQQAENISAE